MTESKDTLEFVTLAYSKSVVGSRDYNQDSSLIVNDRGLFAVADGVGGGVAGDVASQMAVEALREGVKVPADLKDSVLKAQEKIVKEAMEKHGAPVMGTTLTAVLLDGGMAHVCHVGDSRLYHFCGSHLELKTEDQEFFDENLQATVLGSYLGIPTEEHPLEILQDSFLVEQGDRLLLCSDGLYRQIDESRVVEILQALEGEPELLVDRLCVEAAEKSFSDNVTVVYVLIEAGNG